MRKGLSGACLWKMRFQERIEMGFPGIGILEGFATEERSRVGSGRFMKKLARPRPKLVVKYLNRTRLFSTISFQITIE